MALETPVLVVIWRRPDTTQKVIDCLAQVEPRSLYVVADGPSSAEMIPDVQRTRSLFENLPWDCEVVQDYSDRNLGLALRVTSGITAAFRRFDELIVLEDDILTDPSFFGYCTELLERYRDHPRIMQITGVSVSPSLPAGEPSYKFTQSISPWGWASWKRAWDGFDCSFFASRHARFLRRHPFARKLKALSGRTPWWPKVRRDPELRKRIAACGGGYAHWLELCDRRLSVESWAGLFGMWVMQNDGLVVHPRLNLCRNIGLRPDAVHTRPGTQYIHAEPLQHLPLPLVHPDTIELDVAFQKDRLRRFETFAGGRRGTIRP